MHFKREPGYRPEPCRYCGSGSCNAPAGKRAPKPDYIMRQTPLALALGAVFISSAHAETLPEFVGETIVVTPTRASQKSRHCSKSGSRARWWWACQAMMTARPMS